MKAETLLRLACRRTGEVAGLIILAALAGCASPGARGLVPVRQASLAKTPAQTEPVKKFSLAWESVSTFDGEVTGIESTTNLTTWKLEAEWPLVTQSNRWTDYQPDAGQKFYRAFNREP